MPEVGAAAEYYHIWESKFISLNATAALAFQIWDAVICLDDEIHYIWTQSRNCAMKWVFLFLRYFGLMAQLRLAIWSLTLNNPSVAVCRIMYAVQCVAGGVLMACIEVILMIRLYCLYNRSRWIALLTLTCLVCEIAAIPIILHSTLLAVEFNSNCLMMITWGQISLFGVTAVLPKIFIIGLTLAKYVAAIRAGWGRIPMIIRLTRDGSYLVLGLFVVWLVVSIGSMFVNNMFAYVGYYWILAIIPISGCRVVLNMQRLPSDVRAQRDTNAPASSNIPELSTCISVMSLRDQDIDPSLSSDGGEIELLE